MHTHLCKVVESTLMKKYYGIIFISENATHKEIGRKEHSRGGYYDFVANEQSRCIREK